MYEDFIYLACDWKKQGRLNPIQTQLKIKFDIKKLKISKTKKMIWINFHFMKIDQFDSIFYLTF